MKKFLWFSIGFHALVLLGIVAYFNPQWFFWISSEQIEAGAAGESVSEKTIPQQFTITVSKLVRELDPHAYDFFSERELHFVYESLVTFDERLNIVPVLATSWGRVDDNTWKFLLRQNVTFHDGTPFSSADVLASFERALSHPRSSLKTVLDDIDHFEARDTHTLLVYTKTPLLNLPERLSTLYILPESKKEQYFISRHIGTGRFELHTRTESESLFSKYEHHWKNSDMLPQKLVFQQKENKYARMGELSSGKTDVLADVPPSFLAQIEADPALRIVRNSGTKSVFLLFQQQHPFLTHKKHRQALNTGLNRKKIEELIEGSGKLASQFVGSGIFGFNSKLLVPEYNFIEAQKIIGELFHPVELSLVLTEENRALGELLAQEWQTLGIQLVLEFVDDAGLITALEQKEADMFLLGWDFAAGTVERFAQEVLFSGGRLNGIHFANTEVDTEVQQALQEENTKKRLVSLQKIMQIVQEEVVGVPLFSFDTFIAVKKESNLITLRPDGMISFAL